MTSLNIVSIILTGLQIWLYASIVACFCLAVWAYTKYKKYSFNSVRKRNIQRRHIMITRYKKIVMQETATELDYNELN
jgi:hypothetical protein